MGQFLYFKLILTSNPLHEDPDSTYKALLDEIWPLIFPEIFTTDKPYTQLGFPSEGNITGYYSPNMTKDNLKLIQEFLKTQNISVLNTRAFKDSEGKITVTVGSIDKKEISHEFKNVTIIVKYGEFSQYLEEVNYFLK